VPKKSYQHLKSLFENLGFKFRNFCITFVGDYSPEDADWNYKDVKHVNVVHKNIYSIQAATTRDVSCNINLQKIPILGFEIPMTLFSYDVSKYNPIYISTMGPYIIIVSTLSELINKNQTKVATTFSIGSKGLFRIMHPIIEHILRKNNEALMRDDIPMRNRRGQLRKNNHIFYKNTDSYSFEFTEDTDRSNVYLNENKENFIKINKQKILEAKNGDIIGEENGVFSFFVTIDQEGKKKIWPSTCSHEGAKLNKKCLKQNFLMCPWHNKKINYLIEVNKQNFNLKPNIDYAMKITENFVNFKYRNNPKYYEKKPYKFLKYED
jgi:nitrite reductase/ring-hydroxylating ferredoxin subunit